MKHITSSSSSLLFTGLLLLLFCSGSLFCSPVWGADDKSDNIDIREFSKHALAVLDATENPELENIQFAFVYFVFSERVKNKLHLKYGEIDPESEDYSVVQRFYTWISIYSSFKECIPNKDITRFSDWLSSAWGAYIKDKEAFKSFLNSKHTPQKKILPYMTSKEEYNVYFCEKTVDILLGCE